MARRARARDGDPAKQQGHKTKQKQGEQARPAHRTRLSRAELEAICEELDDAILDADPDRVGQIIDEHMLVTQPKIVDVLVQRLIEGRERAPGVALMIVSDLAGPNAPQQFRKIADSTDASDIVRLEAQRLHGFSLDDTAERVTFLETLTDADTALKELAATAGYSWPDRQFILSEVLAYLKTLTPERRLAILTRVVDEHGPASIPLLHALVHDPDSDIQVTAIDRLTTFGFAGSVGPLERLARTSANDTVRERAQMAIQSDVFVLREVPFDDDDLEPFPSDDVGMPTQAILSSVSGIGEQSMFVLRQLTDAIATGVAFFMHDRSGFDDAYSLLPNAMDGIYHEAEFAADPESRLSVVSPPVARGAFTLAIDQISASKTPIPGEIEVWEPFLHDSYPPVDDEPIEYPTIDATGYAGRHDLVERGNELYEETDYFYGWVFDEEPTVALMNRVDLPDVDEWTDADYRATLEELVIPDLLARLPGRLERQAYLLDLDGQTAMKDIALAVAASLWNASIDDLVNNAFMRTMARISVDTMRNPFGGDTDDGTEIDMEDFDPELLAEAMETLGVNPDDLLRSLGLSQEDLPRERR